MRVFFVPAVLAGLGGLPLCSAVAQQTPPPQAEKKVTVNLKGEPLRRALAQLFRGTGLKFVVAPDVPNVPITLHFTTRVDLETALGSVLDLAGATYSRQEDTYLIRTPFSPERRVTLDLKGVPLRQALRKLFRGTGLGFRVAADIPDTPISAGFNNTGFSAALSMLLRSAGLTYRVEPRRSGLYIVERINPAVASRKVTMAFDHWSLEKAIERLFAGTNLRYRVEPDVAQTEISASVKDLEFERALDMLMGPAGATYAREGDTYVIRARP